MRVIVIILMLVGMVTLPGCDNKSTYTSGVVGWRKEFSIGSFAPDIPFMLTNQEQFTLHEVREPVTILIFIKPWTDICCRIRPDLLSLRKEFHVLPVTVVQILLPVGECSHGSGCMNLSNFDNYDIILLCDIDGVAWRAYGQPDPNTVILINQKSKIVDIQKIENLKIVAEKAYWMARDINDY
jgi:peroxiredoxin